MEKPALSRFQHYVGSWQRRRGTAAVVAAVTVFSTVASGVTCAIVYLVVYGSPQAAADAVGPIGLILPIVAPLVVAPLASVQLVGALGLARGTLDELERLSSELLHMALHDPLTGVLNRRGFFELLQAVDRRAHMVAVIDLDGFKGVNDRYGHAAGDVALQEVARTIEQATSSTSIIGRVGGDEFLVCAPATPDFTARLTSELAEVEVTHGGARFSVTSSIGFAECADPADLDAGLAAADQALYVQKAERSLMSNPI